MRTGATIAWTVSLATFTCLGTSLAAQPTDALDEALGLGGMTRADLGWRPKGWWLRFPADIPYKLRHFDDLLAEPLANVSYVRTLASSVRTCLAPDRLNKPPEKSDGALYTLVHSIGVDVKFGAFRSYSVNLTAVDTPLDEAILAIHHAVGRPTKFVTFGTESPYPLLENQLAEKAKAVPRHLSPILGRLVLNVAEAHRWAELAFRNVPAEVRTAVASRLNVGEEQVDALDYAPEFDDAARMIDEASLWYAGLKCVEALDEARQALTEALATDPAPDFSFDWETPFGWIRIRGGGDDQIDATDALLVVDLTGDDLHTGPAGASNAQRPIGLILDLAGDDRYSATTPAQGAGLCGIGVLLDSAGDDRYEAQRYGQGVGQFGLGACLDLIGDDSYSVNFSGQGCGYFGVGVLADAAGRDRYRLYCDGQGLGGVAGVGVLADGSGDDAYEAVRDATITGRPSYHSPDHNVSVSNAQGCAIGRRGDGADGHAWAGGMGALLDIAGDDTYVSGNWSMGTGYWFGTGYLYDGAGSDVYRGVAYSLATGAHFCIGALIDEGGNDQYLAEANSTLSIAWSHDFTVAILLDGGGDDAYKVDGDGLACAINRSVAMLCDLGGNDAYAGNPTHRPGSARFDEKLRQRDGLQTYFADSTSLALFLDIGGEDTYAHHGADNTTWLDPPDSPNWQVRNFSIGVDREGGPIDLKPAPEKTPSIQSAPRASAPGSVDVFATASQVVTDSGTGRADLADATCPEVTSLLGRPLHAQPAGANEQQETKLAEARAGLAAHPDDPDRVIWVGRRLGYAWRMREAVQVYSEGIQRHPGHAPLYRHRGHRYLSLRQFGRAIDDLARAAELIRGQPDAVEPDGLPDSRNVPLTTTAFNIFYHLGLARYLAGDGEGAIEALDQCAQYSRGFDDNLVATTYWKYHALRRLGRHEEAAGLLDPVSPEMNIIENHAYHRFLLWARRHTEPDRLFGSVSADSVDFAILGYGLGCHYLHAGDVGSAVAAFERVVASGYWPAFGYIAAEVELAGLRGQAERSIRACAKHTNQPAQAGNRACTPM